MIIKLESFNLFRKTGLLILDGGGSAWYSKSREELFESSCDSEFGFLTRGCGCKTKNAGVIGY